MAANKGTKVYISPTAASADLTKTEFEALSDWEEISNVGTIPDNGPSEAEITYATLAHGTIKAKDSTDFGGGDLECRYIPDDAGQLALATAAATELDYPIKFVAPDAETGFDPTVIYVRAQISGPRMLGGGTGDFKRLQFTTMNNQYLLVPKAASA